MSLEVNAYTITCSGFQEGIDASALYVGQPAILVSAPGQAGPNSKYVLLDGSVLPLDDDGTLYRGVLWPISSPPSRETGNTGYVVVSPERAKKTGTLLLRITTREYPGSQIDSMGDNRRRRPLDVKSTLHVNMAPKGRHWTEALHSLEPGEALKLSAGDSGQGKDWGFGIFNLSGRLAIKSISETRAMSEALMRIRQAQQMGVKKDSEPEV